MTEKQKKDAAFMAKCRRVLFKLFPENTMYQQTKNYSFIIAGTHTDTEAMVIEINKQMSGVSEYYRVSVTNVTNRHGSISVKIIF